MGAVTLSRRAALTGGVALALAPKAASAAGNDWSGWRIHNAASGRDIAASELVARLARADVVFIGEQHDDPEAHRVEQALLAALHQRLGNRLTLALEMFERDGQPALDEYVAGKSDEKTFARSVTLWSNYRTDYRPLVEYARTHRLPVLASNLPRRFARRVSQEGLVTLRDLPPADRFLVAAWISAPEDGYWERFREIIGDGHGGRGKALDDASLRRFYEAQCAKDDTMAETIVRSLRSGRQVLHINGAFHSDRGQGIPQRVLWRRPLETRLVVVTIVPIAGDPAGAETGTYGGEADYVVLVPDRRLQPPGRRPQPPERRPQK